MYVYIHVCMCVWCRVTAVCMHTYIHANKFTNRSTCTHISTYTRTYIHTNIETHACMYYVSMYKCTHVSIIHVHVEIKAHTHVG